VRSEHGEGGHGVQGWRVRVGGGGVGCSSPLGNVTGYPGVFQSNPCPYPSKPVPVSMCTGFHRYGLRVYRNPRGVMALDMTNEPRKSSASVN
jgi:hypothetical protein